MRVVLPFKLVGQKLVKGRDFPKSVADGSKDSVVIKVDGVPDGCIAKGYFKLSWETGKVYDLTFNGDELVVDEYIVTLPAHANNKYVDYKFSFSVAIWEGDVERLTTNPVEIIVEKSNYSDTTTNTPDIPENQYDEILSVASVAVSTANEAKKTASAAQNLANAIDTTVDELLEARGDHEERIEALEKGGAMDVYNIYEYSFAVSDENGNVALAITEDGEVDFIGKGSGGGGGTAVDYTKCGLPVLYLNGDTTGMTKDDAVDLTYTFKTAKGTTITTGACSCKWQGSSSVSRGYPKRNYTIKFDTAFEATAICPTDSEKVVNFEKPWGAQKKYCAKANWIDPSGVRNVASARLWASIVQDRAERYNNVPEKLLNAPNYGAIDGFPCIIALNGEFLGLYTFNIPKDGWTFNMGDGAAEYVVGGESNSEAACGFTALATFENEDDFAIEHIPDGVADGTLINSFNAAVGAVKNSPTSADWETAVDTYFDVDAAIDYLIFVCCIGARDNLRKNILYGTYDGVKWFMSAYDLDTTFGANAHAKGWYPVVNDRNQFKEACSMHRVFDRIYKYSTAKLVKRYDELRSTVLSDENVWFVLQNFANDIPRAIYDMDADKWTGYQISRPLLGSTTANVENYMHYYRMHCAYLDKEIDALREKGE